MERSDAPLAARARRAYELGRLHAQLPVALFALPPALVALRVCGGGGLTIALAVLLAAALVAAHWRGEEAARGAGAGLLAGAVAFAVPVIAMGTGLCPLEATPRLLALCSGGGLLSGGVLAAFALRGAARPPLYLLAGGVVAALTGGLGCLLAGFAGLAGVTAGIVLGMTPAVSLART
ncbi:MAG TPA: hypothetical protein VF121_12130 [Thermoanaerobaculia bacterium]|nr:hypothetical protein [Thermoanaerobaculia bacterium]